MYKIVCWKKQHIYDLKSTDNKFHHFFVQRKFLCLSHIKSVNKKFTFVVLKYIFNHLATSLPLNDGILLDWAGLFPSDPHSRVGVSESFVCVEGVRANRSANTVSFSILMGRTNPNSKVAKGPTAGPHKRTSHVST